MYMPKEAHNTVITMVPDRCYARLMEETAAVPNRTIYERFEGDKEKTKIWLEKNGKLMSRMPTEVFMKEIQPISRVRTNHSESNGKLSFGNGRGHLLEKLLDLGVDNDTAVRVAHAFYNIVPLHVFLPVTMIEKVAKGWTGEGFMFEDSFVKEIGEVVLRTRNGGLGGT